MRHDLGHGGHLNLERVDMLVGQANLTCQPLAQFLEIKILEGWTRVFPFLARPPPPADAV